MSLTPIQTTASTSSTGATAATSSPPASPMGGAVDKNQFLKLLVAQLENQDPLKPQDSTAFVAQLATFAQLEQADQTNTHLTDIVANQNSATRASMTSMVGKMVTAKADSVRYTPNGLPPALTAHLDAPAAKVKVTITDSTGNVVKTIDLGPRGNGDFPIGWDGTANNGVPVPAGNYSIAVTATTSDGKAVNASPRVIGPVQSLEFSPDGGTHFHIGSLAIQPGDVTSIIG